MFVRRVVVPTLKHNPITLSAVLQFEEIESTSFVSLLPALFTLLFSVGRS